ncbi:hypothetical protein DIPPA_05261 [Diplonema papillatum]|nr:hypothetical protein DIPPA_05261 [Diplonema papillatum]
MGPNNCAQAPPRSENGAQLEPTNRSRASSTPENKQNRWKTGWESQLSGSSWSQTMGPNNCAQAPPRSENGAQLEPTNRSRASSTPENKQNRWKTRWESQLSGSSWSQTMGPNNYGQAPPRNARNVTSTHVTAENGAQLEPTNWSRAGSTPENKQNRRKTRWKSQLSCSSWSQTMRPNNCGQAPPRLENGAQLEPANRSRASSTPENKQNRRKTRWELQLRCSSWSQTMRPNHYGQAPPRNARNVTSTHVTVENGAQLQRTN